MIIAIGCDHAGFALKEIIANQIGKNGHKVLDLGTDNPQKSVDYPDFAAAVSRAVLEGKADRGIVLCGSGVGACVAANKFKGIRAGLCHDTYSAAQAVQHDNVNVLCLGARVIGPSLACAVLDAFLTSSFTNETRHVHRLEKIKALEGK
ncbi:MAG TPA: ribose 5-phosphate isomerase B [Elusimicrobiales bacterium]|nr:ribose 5-phosphate isomerase B [Elusimicrobiales bacterium]